MTFNKYCSTEVQCARLVLKLVFSTVISIIRHAKILALPLVQCFEICCPNFNLTKNVSENSTMKLVTFSMKINIVDE